MNKREVLIPYMKNNIIDALILRVVFQHKFFSSRLWYSYVFRRLEKTRIKFLNYGYKASGHDSRLALDEVDEENRLFIGLYWTVMDSRNLEGLDILEIGCGRGGGASFMAKYLKPNSIVAIDIVQKAIEYCKKSYADTGLHFEIGNAESLRFTNETFDIVVNVESSHCYRHPERFLSEVARVLRPGGVLVLADFRSKRESNKFAEQIEKCGLVVIQREKITTGILNSIRTDSVRRAELVRLMLPKMIGELGSQFVGVEGSRIFEDFSSGNVIYERLVCRKELPKQA